MNYKVGDRVRYSSDFPSTAKPEHTGYREPVILEQGKEGTIAGFHSSGHPSVKWDAGTYRIFRDMKSTESGTTFLDKGTVQLNAFQTPGTNSENLAPVSRDVAKRQSTAATKEREAQQQRDAKARSMITVFGLYFCGPWGFQDFTTAEQSAIAAIFVEHWQESDDAIVSALSRAGFSLEGRMSPPAYYVRQVKEACGKQYQEVMGSSGQPASASGSGDRKWWQFWR